MDKTTSQVVKLGSQVVATTNKIVFHQETLIKILNRFIISANHDVLLSFEFPMIL